MDNASRQNTQPTLYIGYRLEESMCWNRFNCSLKFEKFGLWSMNSIPEVRVYNSRGISHHQIGIGFYCTSQNTSRLGKKNKVLQGKKNDEKHFLIPEMENLLDI
jgi:hypothetical protein